MNQAFIAILAVIFLSGPCLAEENPELNDQKDRESYSFGYQFGQTLKARGIDLNLDIYISAIRDALNGKEPLMSAEEIRAAIDGIQRRVIADGQRLMKEQAEKNLSQGKIFLAENGKKEGIQTLPSGLQYKIMSEGNGPTPRATDTVMVHYRGTLTDGTEFDSSYKRGQPATFRVDGVIRGWMEALQLMKTGAKWQIFIPPELAYGERSPSRAIPPNSTLIFEIELISIKEEKEKKDG